MTLGGGTPETAQVKRADLVSSDSCEVGLLRNCGAVDDGAGLEDDEAFEAVYDDTSVLGYRKGLR